MSLQQAKEVWQSYGREVVAAPQCRAEQKNLEDEFVGEIMPTIKLLEHLGMPDTTEFERTPTSTPACDVVVFSTTMPRNFEIKTTGRITTKKQSYGIWRQELIERLGSGDPLIDNRSTPHKHSDLLLSVLLQFSTLHEEHRRLRSTFWTESSKNEHADKKAKFAAQYEGRRTELIIYTWDASWQSYTGDAWSFTVRNVAQFAEGVHLRNIQSATHTCDGRGNRTSSPSRGGTR